MTRLRELTKNLDVSRTVVSIFLIVLILSAIPLGINTGLTWADILVRVGMNGCLVLAMMISIVCGAGLNFGLPVGILCGLLGGSVALQFNWQGMPGFLGACLCSIPPAILAGWLYAQLLNRTKGSEMTVGNYVAFAVVSLMCIAWLVIPYNNPKIIWPMGGAGLRQTITIEDYYDGILDNFLKIDFQKMGILQDNPIWRSFSIPTGLLLTFALLCLLMWLFMRTKLGIIIRMSGVNPKFSKSIGVNNDKVRTIGIIISTVLAAIGINIYSQSFGFFQFYNGPLMMAFPAMAAILLGGATPKKATVTNVVVGTILFQGLLTMATPVAQKIINTGSLSEAIRIIVQNGIILYALTKIKPGGGK